MSKRTVLEQIAGQYKELLGLHDWEIYLCENCKPQEMHLNGTCGEADVTESTKSAVIKILDPRCAVPTVRDIDVNQVLWHELLHIKFSLIDHVNDTHDRVLHQIVDDLARMLAKITAIDEGEKK